MAIMATDKTIKDVKPKKKLVTDIPKVEAPEPQIPQTPKVSSSTAFILEKIGAGREILKIMEDQQAQNLKYAKEFAKISKQMQPKG